MKIPRTIATVFIGVVLVVGACSPANKTPTLIKVEFGDDAVESWRPLSTVVAVGGVVSWRNTGYINHDVINGEGLFNHTLTPGQSFNYTFTHNGNFTFHDDLNNPYSEIGTITVQ